LILSLYSLFSTSNGMSFVIDMGSPEGLARGYSRDNAVLA
jgi:hypothetical protein